MQTKTTSPPPRFLYAYHSATSLRANPTAREFSKKAHQCCTMTDAIEFSLEAIGSRSTA